MATITNLGMGRLKALGYSLLGYWMVPILVGFVAVAVLAPVLAPHDPIEVVLSRANMPPWGFYGSVRENILGTDQLGRDILSRVMYGCRVTLLVATLVISISAIFGTIIGLVAAYYGGVIEALLMRSVDVLLALPLFLLAIVAASALGPSFYLVVGIIAVLLWPRFARQIRGEGLTVLSMAYIESARAIGASPMRIMFRHMLPNLVPTVILMGTIQANQIVLAEASLSFLGVGIPPPMPSLGRMIGEGREVIFANWWVATIPGMMISIIVVSFTFLGDKLRDRLDPMLRSR